MYVVLFNLSLMCCPYPVVSCSVVGVVVVTTPLQIVGAVVLFVFVDMINQLVIVWIVNKCVSD